MNQKTNQEKLTDRVSWLLVAGLSFMVLSFGWLGVYLLDNSVLELAKTQAMEGFNKDQAFRYWGTMHGGVYVPVSEKTPPNEYLRHVPNRDMLTPSGKRLTLMNPAYMVRQLNEEYAALYGTHGHITSLKPLRPENSPDAWEAQALQDFVQGATSAQEVVQEDGEQYYRYMQPMMTTEGCLKCHAHQGYQVGDVRGGVSVKVPMAPIKASVHKEKLFFGFCGGVIWLLGSVGVLWGRRSIVRLQRKRFEAERLLHLSEARSKSIFDAAVSVAIVMVDATSDDLEILEFSPGAEHMFGYTREEAVGQPVSILTVPDSESHMSMVVERMRQGGEGYSGERVMVRKNGEQFASLFSAHPILDSDNQLDAIVGIGIDITDMKNMQKNLNKYHELVEAAGDMMAIVDRDYNYCLANEAFLKARSMTSEDVLGHNIKEILGVEASEKLSPHLDAAFRGEFVEFEFPANYLEMGSRQMLVKYFPVSRDNDRVEFVGATIRDITTIKAHEGALTRAKEKAESASKAKGEFLANMSHEIRTPLNGVLGMLQLLDMTGLSREQQSYVSTAVYSGKSLLALLTDVLNFSQIEANRVSIRQDRFDLKSLIDTIIKTFEPQAQEKSISLICDVDESVPQYVLSDEGRIRQVLFNLLGNAIKFTDSGYVKLEVSMLSHEYPSFERLIVFFVSDTGEGIADDKLNYCFETFAQADGSATRSFGGVGLGLQIVKRLVPMLGGTLAVESQYGEGTTMAFTLKVGVPELKIEARPAPKPQDTEHAGRLLVAEDDSINALTLEISLEKKGYEVDLAENGIEVLEKLRSGTYDAILMDIRMPEMDGVETTHIIRDDEEFKAVRNIPIIALTALAMSGDREMILAEGMDGYVAKPIDLDQLLETLVALLNKSRNHSGSF